MPSLSKRIAERGFDSDSDDDGSVQDSSCPTFGSVCQQLGVFFQLNFKDIGTRKVNYCLGLLSCFVVVVVTALMLTVLVRLPVLFLRLGELSEGQLDFRVSAGGDAWAAQSLNYSSVVQNVSLFSTDKYSYHAPRIVFDASDSLNAFALAACNFSALSDVWNSSRARAETPSNFTRVCEDVPCMEQFCPADTRTFKAQNWFWIDSAKERRAEMGVKNFPKFGVADGTIPAGYAIIDQGAANALGVAVNETFVVAGSVMGKLLEAFIQADLITSVVSPYSRFGHVAVPFKVLGIIPDTLGKGSTDASPIILTEYATTLAHMAAFIPPQVDSTRRRRLAAVNPEELATAIYWNYPPATRFSQYTYSDYNNVLSAATSFAGPIITSLGFNQVQMAVPIVEFMNGTRFFALFLGLIMAIIICGLGALSIVLVYSLLIVGIQTRQFELGVMRMVGFTRTNLVLYIVTGASLFAVPALVAGLIAAQGAFLGVRGVMQTQLQVELPAQLEASAVGFAIFAGLAIPLFASISPILELLAMSLPDALNTQRGRVQAILYNIETGADRPIDWTMVIFGSALTLFGFLIYYLFPLALFTFDLTLLFAIFFALLLGMLFGCILLSINFDYVMQTFIVYLFFFVEREAVFKLLRANLIAHRQRNRSNSLMFATAVGFIVFITVAFDIQIQSVKYEAARNAGAELFLKPPGRAASNGNYISYAQLSDIDAFLLEETTGTAAGRDKYAGVEWTWIGQDMDFYPSIPNATFETLGRYRSFSSTVMNSAAPNFFDVADPSFLIVNSELASKDRASGGAKAFAGRASDLTLSEYLYTREGSARAVVSTYLQDQFGIEGYNGVNDMFQFVLTRPPSQRAGASSATLSSSTSEETLRSVALPMAVLDAAAVREGFSKFPRRDGQPAVMSLPAFMLRANRSIESISELRVYQICVKASRAQAAALKAALLKTKIDLVGVDARLLADGEKNLDQASTIVGFFFAFTQAIAMAVCFFALISTMSTNIYEASKEIGVLRAIGAPISYVTRVFVEEAFVLVFAACLLGTIVGTVVAYTMLIQRALFTQLPLPFAFPYTNVALMFVLSAIFAFGSTWTPIRALLNAPSITHILRKAI